MFLKLQFVTFKQLDKYIMYILYLNKAVISDKCIITIKKNKNGGQ